MHRPLQDISVAETENANHGIGAIPKVLVPPNRTNEDYYDRRQRLQLQAVCSRSPWLEEEV